MVTHDSYVISVSVPTVLENIVWKFLPSLVSYNLDVPDFYQRQHYVLKPKTMFGQCIIQRAEMISSDIRSATPVSVVMNC